MSRQVVGHVVIGKGLVFRCIAGAQALQGVQRLRQGGERARAALGRANHAPFADELRPRRFLGFDFFHHQRFEAVDGAQTPSP